MQMVVKSADLLAGFSRSFAAFGPQVRVPSEYAGRIGVFIEMMSRKYIECRMVDAGDAMGGSIGVIKR
jgi:hypothetical protein